MTSSSEQPKICLCQGVCPVYQDGFKLSHNTCPLTACQYDTRSRSHPAPAERCQFGITKAVCDAHNEEIIKEATRKACEDFAEELKKDLKSRFISSSNQWSKGRNSGLIECCNIIDEHRSITPQSEQEEQPR